MTITQKRRIFIAGGTSGIGLATAQLFAQNGAQVTVAGRSKERVAAAQQTLGDTATVVQLDCSDRAALDEFFAHCTDPFDDLVLAVSGAKGAGVFADLSMAVLQEAIAEKVVPQFATLQAALPQLRKDGSVTFISAASARTATPGAAGLAAVNGAIECAIPTLALELQPLRVNAVSPGVIDTPWWGQLPQEQREFIFQTTASKLPLGHIGKADDVAAAIMFLAHNSFITGTVLECDGGARIK
jgi:NAD(P)-dependent dehydrogenase (short-subunit alcohol dehydrogenase family)